MRVEIKYFDKDITPLELIGGHKSNWVDLRSAEDIELKQGQYYLLRLGVGMKLPKGYEAHVAPRSSTFQKWGILLTNGIGIIDESYCGEDDVWKFPALAIRSTTIFKGDRICQFRIVPKMPEVTFKEVEHMTDPNRGGLGSTGKD